MQLVVFPLSGYNNERLKIGARYMNGNNLIIVSGVSGSGKTSIVSRIISEGMGGRIITCTTRTPRDNNGLRELSGVDYHFLSEGQFELQKASGAFAEYASVYGKNYGTRIVDINATLQANDIAFAIVDVKGALSLMKLYRKALSVFIDVSREDIEKRLICRGDSRESITKRLAEYDAERDYSNFFSIILPNQNNELTHATIELRAMILRRKNVK